MMDSLRTAALHLYAANLQQMPSGHVSGRTIAALAGETGPSLSLSLAARRARFNVDAYVFPKWKALGFETSFLGQIISDVGVLWGGIYNSFEHGAIWAQDSFNHPAYAYSSVVWQRGRSLGFD